MFYGVYFTAIDDSSDLTDPLGNMMAEFPLSPMFARMLLMSGIYTVSLATASHVRYIYCVPSNSFSCQVYVLCP